MQKIPTILIIYQVGRIHTSDVASESAPCVSVCIFVTLGVLWDISFCHWGCNLSSHPLSPRKTGKLKILLCISKTDTLARSHEHTHTYCTYTYAECREKHSPTHKHPSVTLIMLTPTAKLCSRHLIPDNSAIS